MKYGSEINASTFEAVFVMIKNELYLDLNGVMSDSIGDEDYRNTFVTAHSLYKIRMIKDTLQLYNTNYTWFYDYALKNNMPLKHEWVKNAMLLTYKTDELQSFIAEHNNEQGIFENPISLIRNHVDITEKIKMTNYASEAKSSNIISQTCIPEFPLKDGWLGGGGCIYWNRDITITPKPTVF